MFFLCESTREWTILAIFGFGSAHDFHRSVLLILSFTRNVVPLSLFPVVVVAVAFIFDTLHQTSHYIHLCIITLPPKTTIRSFLLLLLISLASAFTVAPDTHTTHHSTSFLQLHPDQAKELEACAGDHFIQKCAEKVNDCPPKVKVLEWCKRMIASGKTPADCKTDLMAKKN